MTASSELARVAAHPGYGLTAEFSTASGVLDDVGKRLALAAADPGWWGRSADAASDDFATQARRALRNGDALASVSAIIGDANAALEKARVAARTLPLGELTPLHYAGIAAGGWVLLGPFGAVSGPAGAAFANAVLGAHRDHLASIALARLRGDLEACASRLLDVAKLVSPPAGGRPGEVPVYPGDREEGDMTPWELGAEWLGGAGNHRDFVETDAFTELLRQHPHYDDVREQLRLEYDRLHLGATSSQYPWNRPELYKWSYALTGIEGVGKYIVDYSTLLTGGATGNLAVTYLGSHTVDWEVIGQRPDGGYEVRITAENSSSLQSATRPPLIGYDDWYMGTIGEATNQFSEVTGFGKTTSQTITWTETIYP